MPSNGLNIRRLPLHDQHAAKNARFGEFGEWEVPLYYTSILEEHEAVRTQAGLFDISHMGEFTFSGEGAEAFLDGIFPRNITQMKAGQAWYMPLLNDEGKILDDVILYREGREDFLLVVNAGNVDKDYAWIESLVTPEVVLKNLTEDMGLLALQGPKSLEVMQNAFGEGPWNELKYYHFASWNGGMVARTGYTGEDGFEIMVPKAKLEDVWNKIMGQAVVPVGFGCRDTLRLEAGMPLCGHDMNEENNPFEAGIGWTIDLEKSAFTGHEALRQVKATGVEKKLIGFEMIDRGIPREGYGISKNAEDVGRVTSGTFSPTFKKNIGMGYIAVAHAEVGSEIDIIIRDKQTKAKIVKLPFYKRSK